MIKGVAVACGERGRGFDSRPHHLNSETGYLLLPSRDMAKIPLKRRKSPIQPNPIKHDKRIEYVKFFIMVEMFPP